MIEPDAIIKRLEAELAAARRELAAARSRCGAAVLLLTRGTAIDVQLVANQQDSGLVVSGFINTPDVTELEMTRRTIEAAAHGDPEHRFQHSETPAIAASQARSGSKDTNRPISGPERKQIMSTQAIVPQDKTLPDIPLYDQDNEVQITLACEQRGRGKRTFWLVYGEGVLSKANAESGMALAAASAAVLTEGRQYAGSLIVRQEAEVNGVRFEQGCATGVLTEADVLDHHEGNVQAILVRLAAQRAKHR